MTQIGDGSRLQNKRQKRRKGILLNVCIGIVLLAAVTVAYQVFFTSSGEKAAMQKKTEPKKEVNKESSKKKEESANKKEDAKKQDEAKENTVPATKTENEKVTIEGQQDPNVAETYTNRSWKPIGTSQSEPHTTKFDSSSQDWKEMTQSISYALNIPADTLTILFLGNNGPNKAIGTVQAKDTKQKYKVYIEWAESKGWQPTLVQRMK